MLLAAFCASLGMIPFIGGLATMRDGARVLGEPGTARDYEGLSLIVSGACITVFGSVGVICWSSSWLLGI